MVALAGDLGTTRSAAAVELWRDRIEGAVVAIGNAPTALFHLLERLDEGWPKPAVILGFPVGFVGAAESKAELVANPRGCEFVALKGRRGGSAMASAAVNSSGGGLAGGGDMSTPWLHIVGIGEDGMAGLSAATRAVVEAAMSLSAATGIICYRTRWRPSGLPGPSPFDALIDTLEGLRGKRVCGAGDGGSVVVFGRGADRASDYACRDHLSSAIVGVSTGRCPNGLVDGGCRNADRAWPPRRTDDRVHPACSTVADPDHRVRDTWADRGISDRARVWRQPDVCAGSDGGATTRCVSTGSRANGRMRFRRSTPWPSIAWRHPMRRCCRAFRGWRTICFSMTAQ